MNRSGESGGIVDDPFVTSYLKVRDDRTKLHDFYRCPDCDGPIKVTKSRTNEDRQYYLPWEDPTWRYDFDLPNT